MKLCKENNCSRVLLPLLSLLLLDLACRAPAAAPEPQPTLSPGVVSTSAGLLRGFEQDGVQTFLGIPYAAPPLSKFRWREPQPAPAWEGEYTADQYPPECVQKDGKDGFKGSEDCLYLNIWSPAGAQDLPVMFFLHGGGNVQGSTSIEYGGVHLYDGADLARRGEVIVVTAQYRLGSFGFLVLPVLAEESAHNASGNYGLMGQVLALEWVQANIAVFGGDASRVLLFGESAGAVDTCMLMASPLAEGLFSRAAMQSGGCNTKLPEARITDSVTLADTAGCVDEETRLECLRGLDIQAVMAAVPAKPVRSGLVTAGFGPVVDGYVLPEEPIAAIAAGRHNAVPFIIGANANETASLGVPAVLPDSLYRIILEKILGSPLAEQVRERHSAETYGTVRQAYIQATTDSQFVCPSRRIARALAGGQDQPVYRYFFTHEVERTYGPDMGAFHGLELFFLFQHVGQHRLLDESPENAAVQAALLGYWTHFAANGDPNAPGLVTWQPYSADSDLYLEIGATIQPGEGVRTDLCDFWDSISANW